MMVVSLANRTPLRESSVNVDVVGDTKEASFRGAVVTLGFRFSGTTLDVSELDFVTSDFWFDDGGEGGGEEDDVGTSA